MSQLEITRRKLPARLMLHDVAVAVFANLTRLNPIHGIMITTAVYSIIPYTATEMNLNMARTSHEHYYHDGPTLGPVRLHRQRWPPVAGPAKS
jgi:hypothetical protein